MQISNPSAWLRAGLLGRILRLGLIGFIWVCFHN